MPFYYVILFANNDITCQGVAIELSASCEPTVEAETDIFSPNSKVTSAAPSIAASVAASAAISTGASAAGLADRLAVSSAAG